MTPTSPIDHLTAPDESRASGPRQTRTDTARRGMPTPRDRHSGDDCDDRLGAQDGASSWSHGFGAAESTGAREAALTVMDRWIAQADQIAARHQAQQRWCDHARWQFLAAQLRKIRAEARRAVESVLTVR